MTEPLLDDRYRLIAPLAEGGMSVVWHGRDEVLARSVAVKVIKTEAGPSAKFVQRVRREATALARLNHRHIANVYDYGESVLHGVPAPYLVMELVEGESLGATLRRGPITWPTAVGIAAQVAGALAAAHAAGVVHCDVTPGNVMLCADGVKIIDFGIASTAGDFAEGVVFGTPAYLAPERRNGGQAIPASDVYGIGLLLYEMLAGRLPWPDGTATEVVAAHRTIPPAPLPEVAGLPEPIAALCIVCLDIDPGRRPLSRELSTCLNEVARSVDPHSRRIHSEVTARIRPATPARSPAAVASGKAADSAGSLAPAAAFKSGPAMGSGPPSGPDVNDGSGVRVGAGVAPGAAFAIDSGPTPGPGSTPHPGSGLGGGMTALDAGIAVAYPLGSVAHQVGSARSGRSRSGTRIMPHGVTALPDPGQPTQPIDEPVGKLSWRDRSRRPSFALPSLLLLVLVVCFGFSEARAGGGAAAGAVPKIQPANPGLIVAPPQPMTTPSATTTGGPGDDAGAAGVAGVAGAGGARGGDASAGSGAGGVVANHSKHHGSGQGIGPGRDDGSGEGVAAAPEATASEAAQPEAAAPEAAALACHVDYRIVTQWMVGFTAQMTVTNVGPAEVSGWTLQFRLADGQRVGSGWNGQWEQHGSEVSVRSAGFNDAVPPGGTVALGFVGVLTDGTTAEPSSFALNGTSCTD
jgi:hypothetical protein